MKPMGWRYESHRHALAAKGVKTRYLVVKDDFVKTPYKIRKEQENLNWPGGKKEMRGLAKDPMGGGVHNEFDVDGNIIQKPLSVKEGFVRTEIYPGVTTVIGPKGEKQKYIGYSGEESEKLFKSDALKKLDVKNKEYFDEIHDMTDAEEIKEILGDMKEDYKELGLSDADALRRAKRALEKSKSYGTALNTSDDPDEFLALKDNFNWFADLDKSERTANLYAGGDVVEKQAAFNAYASAPEEFETTIYAAKKSKWKDTLKGGRADKMQSWMFDQKELKRGTLHEMEHTTNKKIAQEIAMDHLRENSAYYEKLERMERK